LVSKAFVAVTVHVPAAVLLKLPDVIEHPVPETVYETEPEPEPPLVCKVIGEPNVPVVDVTVTVACGISEITPHLIAILSVMEPAYAEIPIPTIPAGHRTMSGVRVPE
jgi:hypothetical protein